jgi:Mg2+/Co2+ transporter CorC
VRRLESYVSSIPLASLVVLALTATIATLVAELRAGIPGIVVATPAVVVAVVAVTPRLSERAAAAGRSGTIGHTGLTHRSSRDGRIERNDRKRADLGERGGAGGDDVFQQSEQQMIESIIDFGDTVAREVMVPRPDMITVASTFRAADVMEIMLLNGYSRLPACGSGTDDIVGLVYAKDLMRAERDGKEDRPVAELLRAATFVPETKRLPQLLREMQQRKFHMAIVVDEYGGTAGLLTLEDIVEELVGEIVDEYDVEDPMIEPLPGGDALVRGRTSLDEINDLLDANLPEGDWDTVGGLIYSRLGHVPVEGETLDLDGWRLTAQRIQGRRIGRVRIARLGPEPDGQLDGRMDGQVAGGPSTDGHASAAPVNGALNGRAGADGHDRPDRPPRPPDRPAGGDAGQVGGIEALPFGVLVFVVGTLLLANVWAVVDAKLAVDAAAREATRRYVEAAEVTGAEEDAVAAGLSTLEAQGRDPSRARVELQAVTTPDGRIAYERCARATFEASYHVPALTLPFIGGYGEGFEVTSRHSELVDPFRDGVPGDASTC